MRKKCVDKTVLNVDGVNCADGPHGKVMRRIGRKGISTDLVFCKFSFPQTTAVFCTIS